MGLENIDDYHHEFGLKLAKKGYLVIAPYLITQSKNYNSNSNKLRNEIHKRALPLGLTLNGLEMVKLIETLDYVEKLPYVNKEKISTYGISLGGELAFYLGALDQRVTVTIVSQYITDRTNKLIDLNNKQAYWKYENSDFDVTTNMLVHFTDIEIASLIIPRKLFIEAGSKDSRTLGAIKVESELQNMYKLLNIPATFVKIEVDQGGHEIFLKGSKIFLDNWLKNN